jgi:hypothetical protein
MAAGPGAALDVIIRPGPSLSASNGIRPFAADYSNGTYVGSEHRSTVFFANGFE